MLSKHYLLPVPLSLTCLSRFFSAILGLPSLRDTGRILKHTSLILIHSCNSLNILSIHQGSSLWPSVWLQAACLLLCFFFKKIFILWVWVFCQHVCVHHVCAWCPHKPRRGHWILWGWSYRLSFGGQEVHNHCALSPACWLLLYLVYLTCS